MQNTLNWHSIFGFTSGLIIILSNIPYLLSILRSTTQPSQVTWLIWTINSVVLLFSSYASGAKNTLWMLVALVISQSIVTICAFKYSRVKWGKLDKFCLAGAGGSLLLWLLSGSPLVAILMSTVIDLLGALPTISKIKLNPDSEDIFFWILAWGGALLNLLAIEEFVFSDVFFPVYIFGLDCLILFLLLKPRPKKRLKRFPLKRKFSIFESS